MKTANNPGTPTKIPGNRFVELPVDRALELRFDLDLAFDGAFRLPDVAGARVKVVVYVPEDVADLVDRVSLRNQIEEAGAIYVKDPVVHVIRSEVRRDARHEADLSLEESIAIFAAETSPRDAENKVAFAVALAREADGGEK